MQQYLFLPLPANGVKTECLNITGTDCYRFAAVNPAHGGSRAIEVGGVKFTVHREVHIDALLAFSPQQSTWPAGTRFEAAIFERPTLRQVSPRVVFEATDTLPGSYCELRLQRTPLKAGDYTVIVFATSDQSHAKEQELALSSYPEYRVPSSVARWPKASHSSGLSPHPREILSPKTSSPTSDSSNCHREDPLSS